MNATIKYGLVAVGAVFLADKISGTFTDSGDSETEKLMWKIVTAAVTGAALSKLV